MTRSCKKFGLWFFVFLLSLTSFMSVPVATAETGGTADIFRLNLALVNDGPHARVSLGVTNLTSLQLDFPSLVFLKLYRADGTEAPTTLLQRQITGKTREGEKSLLDTTDHEPLIEPGSSLRRFYNVADYYDLNQPGNYRLEIVAYAEVFVKGGKLRLSAKPNPITSEIVVIHVP